MFTLKYQIVVDRFGILLYNTCKAFKTINKKEKKTTYAVASVVKEKKVCNK